MRKTLPLLMCLLMACATARPDYYRPEDCHALSREARTAGAWSAGAQYTAVGLGAGTALAEAAKDSKPLTLSLALAAVLAGAVSLGADSAADAAHAEWQDNCPAPMPVPAQDDEPPTRPSPEAGANAPEARSSTMEKHDTLKLAQEGYEAYGDAAGWKTFDGRQMPKWEGVGEVVQARWQAAARRIAKLVDSANAEEASQATASS
jgi:hypothetical protein